MGSSTSTPEQGNTFLPAFGKAAFFLALFTLLIGILGGIAASSQYDSLVGNDPDKRSILFGVALVFSALMVCASFAAFALGVLSVLGKGKAGGSGRSILGTIGLLLGGLLGMVWVASLIIVVTAWIAAQDEIATKKVVAETPAYAMPESHSLGASEDNPQVVNGDEFEDYYHAVRLRRPSSDWRFMDRKKAQTMNADAFMGIVNPGKQGFVVVIGELLEGITLEEYVDLVLGNSPVLQGAEMEKIPGQVDGYPSIVVTQRATIEGLDFTYRFQFVKREQFFYQMMGWTMSGEFAKVEPDFVAIANSLSFSKDRQPQVPDTTDSQDDQGVDWKIANSIYSNASFGFQLKPTKGFRLTGHEELMGMSTDAAAGIICTKPTFYQVYVVEPVGDVDRDAFLQLSIARAEQGMGLNDQDATVTEVRVGNLDAQQYSYQKVNLGGAEIDYHHAYFYRDALFFHITSWWPSAEAEQASLKLLESYAHFQWLDETQRTELAAELDQSDVNNAVGPRLSYRNGVFADFQFGFMLKTPPGLWQAVLGDELHQQNTAARLILTKLSEGVNVVVIPETLDMTHADYHEALRQGMGVADEVPSRTVERGELTLFVSEFSGTVDGLDFSYRLVTAARGEQRVQLLLSSLRSNEENLDQRLPEVIAGFEFSQTQPKMIEKRGTTTIDHRLGFQLTDPSGLSFTNTTTPEIQPLGTLLTIDTPTGGLIVMAICAPVFDEEIAVDAMIQNLEINVEPDSRQESKSTLAGLPARKIEMSGQMGRDEAFIKIWIAKRGRTTYLMVTVGREGSREHREAESFKRCLTLID